MKRTYFLITATVLLSVMLFSCNKDDKRDYLVGGTPPVVVALTNTGTDSVSLVYTDSSKQAIKISWTNPEYQFTTGINSQDVSYLLEIDTAGANFTNPQRKQISISKELSLMLLESQLNDYMFNQLKLEDSMQHTLEVRVTATIAGNTAPIASNVIQLKATPYVIPPKVTPPSSGELYITGNALASDWTNAPPENQKFTRVSNTLYEITVPLIGGNSYTFLPVHGSWDFKYSIAKKNDPDEVNGGDFQWQGNDILAPAANGTYKIVVDFQSGKFTVTQQ